MLFHSLFIPEAIGTTATMWGLGEATHPFGDSVKKNCLLKTVADGRVGL